MAATGSTECFIQNWDRLQFFFHLHGAPVCFPGPIHRADIHLESHMYLEACMPEGLPTPKSTYLATLYTFRGPSSGAPANLIQNRWQPRKGPSQLWHQNFGIPSPGRFTISFYPCLAHAGKNFVLLGVSSLAISPFHCLCAFILFLFNCC